MKTIHVKVQGMTCASCEVILERRMKKVEGVHNVQVNRAKEKATIHCEDSIQLEDLQAAVAEKGYTLTPHDSIEQPVRLPFIVKNKKLYAEIGAVFVFIIGVYFILSQLNLIPEGLSVTDNMSYGFVFIVGLVAATSTCLAVAGGLLLAVAGKYNKAYPHLNGWQKFKPHIYFNVGRIVSYTLLGGAIGLLGSFLTVSSTVTGWITIIASALMILMGLQLLQIFPWLSKIQLKMPKFIAHKIYDASHQKKAPGKVSTFLFGGSTFFLPCGFTQALQLYVLAQGDFMTGALTMLAFSIGTLPSLAGIGVLASFAKGKMQRYFMTFSAVIVIILGVFAMPSGFTLLELGSTQVDDSQLMSIDPNQEVQVIDMKVDYLDYKPDKFTIKRGVPVEWNIDGTTAVGCAKVIAIPALGITENLASDGITTITFTPTQTGELKFSCSMGMAGPGTFEVV